MLLIFVLLAIVGWGHHAPAGVNPKLYPKTNLATLVIWAAWWPAMIWVTMSLGRAWCTVCPLGLVSNSERIGRHLSICEAHLRCWMLSDLIIVALYALIQFLVAAAHINPVRAWTCYLPPSLPVVAILS